MVIRITIYIYNNHKNNIRMMIMHEDQNQKWCHKFMSLSKQCLNRQERRLEGLLGPALV